jgi:histidine triad (HIT) family protein
MTEAKPGESWMTESNCIFCRIVRGEIPSNPVYETAHVLAFRDLHPQAPVHVLVIPKRHVDSLASMKREDAEEAGSLLLAAATVARLEGIEDSGYRVVTNIGDEGGQSVGHLHLHVLGGRPLRWPPG